MEKYLNKRCERLFYAFKRCGYQLYAVGGCVRDSILGIEPKDIDFCTNATPDQMREVCNYLRINYHLCVEIIPTGEKFGTLTFRFPEFDEQYEITTYRNDGRYEDGRHPKEVSFSDSLEEDLKRRDFTCNAIAYSIFSGYVDPFNGKKDIEENIIKCVGNPEERFNEDALRIIRLVRFAIKYDFEIDIDTYTQAKKLIDNIEYVSKERIGAEFIKIFSYKYNTNFKDSKNYKTYDLLTALLRKIFPNCQKDEIVQDIIWFDKVPLLKWYDACIFTNEQDIATFINQFAVGSDICNGVKNLNRAFKFLNQINNKYWEVKKVFSIVRTLDERKAFISRIITEGNRTLNYFIGPLVNDEPYSIEQLAINGDWVMEYYNIPPGPKVKEVLEKVLDWICIYPENNNKTAIKQYLDEEMNKNE